MDPVSSYNAGTTDLLERILDKGVMLRLDLVISVADIPLVGLQAHLAVASIETMNAYGMLVDFDTRTRQTSEQEGGRRRTGGLEFAPGEHVVLEEFASAKVDLGWTKWRPGRLYITNRRIVLTRAMPDEILFEASLADIDGVGTALHSSGGVMADALHLRLTDGRNVVLRSSRSGLLEGATRDVLRRAGRQVEELAVDDVIDDDG